MNVGGVVNKASPDMILDAPARDGEAVVHKIRHGAVL